MLKKISSIVITLALSMVSFAAQAMKVGTVDLQKALQESKKGKSAKASIEKEFDIKKKKIDAEHASIQKLSEEFQKKSLVMSEKARSEKGMEIQQKMGAWQELVQKSQTEFQERQLELTRPILEGLRSTTAELAKKKSLDMVYEVNSGLLFAAEASDMTSDLIKAYDEKNPK